MTDTTPTEEKPQKKSREKHWLPSLMAIVALVIAIFAAIGMALAYQEQKQSSAEFHNLTLEIDQLKQSQQQSQNQAQQQTQKQIDQFKQQIDAFNGQLSHFTHRQGAQDITWQLAESKYLIKLAVYNVSLTNNPTLAIRLLQAADKNLQPLSDPDLLPVRKTLADNIAQLKATPSVDIAGLILKLQSLQQEAASLPMYATPLAQLKTQQETSSAEPDSWKTRFEQTLSGLKKLVVIHDLSEPVKPLVTPEQMVYLVENIQLQLSLAEWAVLHQDRTVYIASLDQANKWIKSYFINTQPATQNMTGALEALLKENIAPKSPNINSSLDAIDQVIQQQSNKEQTT